jgi:NAD(P)-dependent dehydrogenase (short-subunit alcohol dehydrogenase family)
VSTGTTTTPQQRVVITAGAAGIGRAMAQAFAAIGARVWVTDIDRAALAACPREWRSEPVDVADPLAMDELFARVQAEWGGLDTLCANAGIAGETALVEDQDYLAFQRCLNVTLGGAVLATQRALPMMKAARRGCILFTGSTSGLFGTPYRVPYSAAKWAVNGLMKTVAMEAGPFGIRANVIAPGCVEGPRIDDVIAREASAKGCPPEAVRDAYLAGTSLRAFTRPEDVAAMAVFLASPAGARISGQVVTLDGHTENPDPKV